jgi:hypothetical protein
MRAEVGTMGEQLLAPRTPLIAIQEEARDTPPPSALHAARRAVLPEQGNQSAVEWDGRDGRTGTRTRSAHPAHPLTRSPAHPLTPAQEEPPYTPPCQRATRRATQFFLSKEIR